MLYSDSTIPAESSYHDPLVDIVNIYGAGYVPSGFTSEVNPADLTFHVVESEATIVEFNLADLSSNQTDEHGDWWDFIYWDYSGDGYFSSSDYYEIRTNSSRVVSIKTYDSWADSWTGDITNSND